MVLITKDRLIDEYVIIKNNALASSSSVLLLVSPNVDGLTSCKIFASLLQSECVPYKIKAVSGYNDLKQINNTMLQNDEINDEINTVILFNCGSTADLYYEIFESLPDHITIYIFDSHRPYDLNNIREENIQIRIFDTDNKALTDYPLADLDRYHLVCAEYEDIYGEEFTLSDSDDSDDDDSDDEDMNNNKKRPNNSNDMQREQMRLELTDLTIKLETYYRGSYYSTPSSILAYDLCTQLGKDDNKSLWWAIVGTTEQYINQNIDDTKYIGLINYYNDEVKRHNQDLLINDIDEENKTMMDENGTIIQNDNHVKKMADDELVSHVRNGHISYNVEYRFMLLRHWTLYDAMYHSPYITSKLKLWESESKLNLFLAKLGIPLNECKQPYQFMTSTNKAILLRDSIDDVAFYYTESVKLNQLKYPSFLKRHDSNFNTSASDIVYAITSLLEDIKIEDIENLDKNINDIKEYYNNIWHRNFWSAYDSLSEDKIDMLKYGLEKAKELQIKIVLEATAILKKNTFYS